MAVEVETYGLKGSETDQDEDKAEKTVRKIIKLEIGTIETVSLKRDGKKQPKR